MKKLLMLALLPLIGMAQSVNLGAGSPVPVSSLGAGVVGTPGTSTACYWVVVNYVGGSVLSAAPICPTNIPNTLSSMNYVQLGWQAAAGTSVTYDVLKTATKTPPTLGASTALSTGLTVTTATDQGGSLSPYTQAGFTYPQGLVTLLVNNRDFAVPAFECSGTVAFPCQASFGQIVPKGSAGVIKLGSKSSPLTIDGTGAAFITEGSPSPGAALGTVVAGVNYSVSANLTLAQVNAGTVILPAITGQTYKVNHAVIQAIGGAAAACTLVEIADTAGTPIVAMSAAVAALTQNTRVSEATAAATVTTTAFAPTALTASQGIQVLSTGSACTTATSFNVIVFFTINS
jgi:hypothetical protein